MLADLVSIPPHWGLFSVAARAHAINDAGQPPEVYVARCGQRLLSAINLYDEPPDSEWICLSCLRWTHPRTPPRGIP
jgi:hypothetical protein